MSEKRRQHKFYADSKTEEILAQVAPGFKSKFICHALKKVFLNNHTCYNELMQSLKDAGEIEDDRR